MVSVSSWPSLNRPPTPFQRCFPPPCNRRQRCRASPYPVVAIPLEMEDLGPINRRRRPAQSIAQIHSDVQATHGTASYDGHNIVSNGDTEPLAAKLASPSMASGPSISVQLLPPSPVRRSLNFPSTGSPNKSNAIVYKGNTV